MKLVCDRCGTICNEPGCPRCAGTLLDNSSKQLKAERAISKRLAEAIDHVIDCTHNTGFTNVAALQAHLQVALAAYRKEQGE